MKILIFAEVYYPDVMGGGEFSTKQMTEGLVKKGHKVTVYCLGKDSRKEMINGVCVKRRYIKGLSEHFLSNTKNNRIKDPFTQFDKIARKRGDIYRRRKWYEAYKAVISEENPDVVHTVSPMSYLGRFNLWRAAYDLKIPVSHVSRGPNLLELKFLGGKLDGYNVRRNAKASSFLTAFAAPSRYMLKRHNQVGIRGRRFNDVIYNAVDFKPVELTRELIEQKENMVLYAGAFRKEKGLNTLIEAVEKINGVRLLLIGGGELADILKADKRVEVMDWMDRKNLFAYMKSAKAVILPSKWNEPFGRILIEAINNGTIAIGSDKGGIPEVLGYDDDYIFQSGNAEELQKRIERVISMPALIYLKEIDRLQETVSGFSDEEYVDNWERFFMQQLR